MKKMSLTLFFALTIMFSGCGTQSTTPTPQSTTTVPLSTTSTHTIREWLADHEKFGAKHEPTIDFDKYEEVITATLGVSNSDNIWGAVIYAEKGWQDGKPHQFYIQTSVSELGDIGGSYTYKHFGPYTDNIVALMNQAKTLRKDEKLTASVELLSDVTVAAATAR